MNGHAVPVKNDTKYKPNAKNNRKYPDYIEKVHKPVKIVQEDIRPSIPKENKEEKGGKNGKDARLVSYFIVFIFFIFLL